MPGFATIFFEPLYLVRFWTFTARDLNPSKVSKQKTVQEASETLTTKSKRIGCLKCRTRDRASRSREILIYTHEFTIHQQCPMVFYAWKRVTLFAGNQHFYVDTIALIVHYVCAYIER